MNKELAKVFTTALVQFIDRERPGGSMCCSNAECVNLETAFCAENFGYIEAFIQRKLSGLTEFEQEVSDIVEYCKEHGEHVAFDYAKRHARTLLALAKKELLSEKMLIEQTYNPDISKAHELGREEGIMFGKAEALKDLPRWEPNQVSYSEEPVLCNGNTILNLGWVHIHIDQLKKLPGFKEDEQ